MPTYRAKKTHVRYGRFDKRVVRAYSDEVTTSEALDPSKPPYYFIPSGFNPKNEPVIDYDPDTKKFTIECRGASSIYYTVDGTEPGTDKTPYTGEVTLSATATVKAVGVYDDITTPTASKQCTVSEEIG